MLLWDGYCACLRLCPALEYQLPSDPSLVCLTASNFRFSLPRVAPSYLYVLFTSTIGPFFGVVFRSLLSYNESLVHPHHGLPLQSPLESSLDALRGKPKLRCSTVLPSCNSPMGSMPVLSPVCLPGCQHFSSASSSRFFDGLTAISAGLVLVVLY